MQQSEIFDFYWPVAEEGYAIQFEMVREINGHNEPSLERWPVLVPVNLSRNRPSRRYAPLSEEPALFRVFAELPSDLTEEGSDKKILAFANQYGHLGGGTEVELIDHRPGMFFADALMGAVMWTGWADEIWGIKRAVALWDLIEDGGDDALATLIHLDPGGHVLYRSDGTEMRLTRDPRQDHLDEPLDLRYFAGIAMRQFVDTHMSGPGHEHTLHPVLTWNPESGRSEARYIPGSLISALWLQFIQAVDGRKRYAKCQAPRCGRWFELDPGSNRADKLYCSSACKMRAYRARRKQNESTDAVDASRSLV